MNGKKSNTPKFKTILDENLQHHTVKTIRYKIYNIAGKVISHSRKTILKVNSSSWTGTVWFFQSKEFVESREQLL